MSDALAETLGLTVRAVLDPAAAEPDTDKWVIYVPVEHADAVRAAVFAAGAGAIGDYSQCSWSTTGIGQFLPGQAAMPAIGRAGVVEQVTEQRIEVVAPARARGRIHAAMRSAHPTRSRPSTSSRCSRCRRGSGSAGSAPWTPRSR